jgi:hypothetical protein
MDKRQEYELIRKFLKENDYDDYDEIDQTDDMVIIYISWGDWKHSHLRADYLMKQLGYVLVNEDVTEENGDDSYSSVHFYTKL